MTATATGPATTEDQGAGAPTSRAARTRSASEAAAWLGLAPYVLFIALFLVIPILVNLWATFAVDGQVSLGNVERMAVPQYASAFASTFNLALASSVLGGVFGILLSWALVTVPKASIMGRVAHSFSVVASQSGGVPLAFAFIATLGTQGVVTRLVADWSGWNLADSFRLSSPAGVTLVYLYFQIPLMAILMMPAFGAIRVQWYEAAQSLGATGMQFIRHVAVPVLLPSALGSVLVLFANAFSAYATAFALANNGINLVPILIGFMLSGNGLPDEGLAAALVTGMMIVVVSAVGINHWLTRRLRSWQQ